MKKLKLFLVVIFILTVVFSFTGCKTVEYPTSSDGLFTYELYTVAEGDNEYQAARLMKYLGNAANVTIPATIQSNDSVVYPVKSIGDGLFVKSISGEESRRYADVYTNNATLTTINIQADIKEIPNRTFYNCTSLTIVNIPEGVEKIGAFSFYGCTKLETITLPSTVNEIAGYAFRECSELTSVNILSTERIKIGDMVFYMIDSTKSGSDQYYIIEDLAITVTDISLYNKADIELEDKENKTKNSWLDYINADRLLEAAEA